MRASFFTLLTVLLAASVVQVAQAEEPVAAYIFPAGGQRGTTVRFHVGGLFLDKQCGFEMLGPGVEVSRELRRTRTVWLEGPLIPLPDSQAAEDYPKDLAGQARIESGATLGGRSWRVWTSQGVTPARSFVIGDLPEIMEDEIDGEPLPVAVQLPVTVNGRIFPREDVDAWSFPLKQGQSVTCVVDATNIGTPLDARIEVVDQAGKRLAESDDTHGADTQVRFTAGSEGTYAVRIHDINFKGGQAYVYRLTLTFDPWIDSVFPLGGRRGGKVKLDLRGQGLPATAEVQLPAAAAAPFTHRLKVGTRETNPFTLELDDFPEHVEPIASTPIQLPAILNGRIGQPAEIDEWPVTLRNGDKVEFDLRALRLGSPLNAILTLKDSSGEVVAVQDNVGIDPPILHYKAHADGVHKVLVAERFRSQGGPRFAYRLRIAAQEAQDFQLVMDADALNLPRGGTAKLRVLALPQNGFKEPITLAVDGLPPGVTVTGASFPPGQYTADLTFKADESARIQMHRLTIHGRAKVGAWTLSHSARLVDRKGLVSPARQLPAQENETLALAVTLKTPFKIVGDFRMQWAPRGGRLTHHYRIERNSFNGPIEVALTDRQARHLQGVTGPTIIVPAGATEFDYTIQLPPWMEIGRTCRACVMGSATITDGDGSQHVVSYSSVNQNEQLVAVIEAGRLGLELERNSLLVVPGQAANLTVRISRSKLVSGPVRVELAMPEHLRGITAEPVVIPAGQNSATLCVRFAAELQGPLNMPLTVRATLVKDGAPLTAEAKLAVVR